MRPLHLEAVLACTCGSRELAVAARPFSLGETRFGLRRCLRCGRWLLDPRPSPDALPEVYDGDYYGTGSRKFVPPVEWIVDSFRDRRARFAERLVRPAAGQRKVSVLDIGCGSGQFLARLARSGFDCHGSELSIEAGKRAAAVPGLHLVVGALGPQSFPDAAFDLISIWHVLEHLPDPDQMLRTCRRWLKPEGVLLVAVPNAGSWQARLFGGAWFHLDPPRHLHHFTRGSLASLLRDAGFRLERVRTLSWEQNVYGILQSALNVLGFPRDEFYDVMKWNRPPWSAARLLLEGTLAFLLAVPSLLFAIAEALAGQGGTLECVAKLEEMLGR